MQINKNKFTTIAYFLMLFSISIPVIFLLITAIFGKMVSGIDLSAGDTVAFLMVIIGIPIAFLTFITGVILSFIIGVLTKSRGLLLISSIPIIANGYAFWKAHLATTHPNGLIFDMLGVFIIEYPLWLYIGYACLVLIIAGYYFYQKKVGRTSYRFKNP